MYGYDGIGMSGWLWVWTVALIVGVLVLIAGLVVAMVAVGARRPAPPGETLKARDVLDQRYARGELDSEEYQERVRTLAG